MSETARHAQTNGKMGKPRIAALTGIAGAATAAAIWGPSVLAHDNAKIIGKVPGVETCGPEVDGANVRAAIGREACNTALTVANNVVDGVAPAGMEVKSTSSEFGTTFGKPSYTISQRSASMTSSIEYRVTFGVNSKGQADLSDIVEEVADNHVSQGIPIIDSHVEKGVAVYNVGFRDPEHPHQPLVYSTDGEAVGTDIVDASNTALAGFQPQ